MEPRIELLVDYIGKNELGRVGNLCVVMKNSLLPIIDFKVGKYMTDEYLLRIEAQERAKTWKCAAIWSWIILVVSNLYWIIR
jgi:hypothetical protein